jgi:hypothetical protein
LASPDPERAAGVAPHERSAARAHGVEIDRRQAHGETAHDALARARRLAARDEAHVGRRPAHVQ